MVLRLLLCIGFLGIKRQVICEQGSAKRVSFRVIVFPPAMGMERSIQGNMGV